MQYPSIIKNKRLCSNKAIRKLYFIIRNSLNSQHTSRALSKISDCLTEIFQFATNSFYKFRIRHLYYEIKKEFNESYYLHENPDVRESKMDPVMHYILNGAFEARNPTPSFSTIYYLKINKDVALTGINPFFHYLVYGRFEERKKQPRSQYKFEQIFKDGFKKNNINVAVPQNVLSKHQFEIAFSKHSCFTQFVLSVSHDNFLNNVGGVQVCIQKEAELSLKKKINYIHISPFYSSEFLVADDNFELLNISLNSNFIGVVSKSTIYSVLKMQEKQLNGIFIHALQGHSVSFIENLTKLQSKKRVIWIHDSYLFCSNFRALRNNIDYCHLPQIDSHACEICHYKNTRQTHLNSIRQLLLKQNIKILCPSEFTKKLFLKKSPLAPYMNINHVHTVKHLNLTLNEEQLVKSTKKINIGFIGLPNIHKGWEDFVRLFNELYSYKQFNFIHIGSSKSNLEEIPFVPFSARSHTSLFMKKTIIKNDIDIVILPSKSPETFNLVCHEAISAGAKVYCYQNSGNIAETVKYYQRGEIFKNYEEMKKAIKSLAEVPQRKQTFKISYSDLSFEVYKNL